MAYTCIEVIQRPKISLTSVNLKVTKCKYSQVTEMLRRSCLQLCHTTDLTSRLLYS